MGAAWIDRPIASKSETQLWISFHQVQTEIVFASNCNSPNQPNWPQGQIALGENQCFVPFANSVELFGNSCINLIKWLIDFSNTYVEKNALNIMQDNTSWFFLIRATKTWKTGQKMIQQLDWVQLLYLFIYLHYSTSKPN